MSTELEELVTPELDVTQDGSNPADGGTLDPKQEEDFLTVNDRTKYRTKEDAVKAFNEAGNRIKNLSQWEKELGTFGVKDPKTAATLLNELRELREKNATAAKGAEGKKTDEPSYTKEEKDVIKLVEKLAPALGFASKQDLAVIKELQDKLAGFEQSSKQSESSRVDSLISDAQDHVSNFLQDAKVEDGDKGKQAVVETLLRSWIESDQERLDKFYAGGATMRGLVREGTEQILKQLGWNTQATPAADPSTVAARAKAQQLKNKTLPVSGSGKKEEQKKGLQNPSGKSRLDDADTVKEAFEMFKANLGSK